MEIKTSGQLSKIIRSYRCVKDTIGMSPAQVYKLIGRNENLYLKISDDQYHGTTYDVEREKDIIQWLKGRLPVPEVLHFEKYENKNFLLISEVEGVACFEDYEKHRSPQKMIKIYSEGIKLFQSVDTLGCPFNNNTDNRLDELDYLLTRNLADTNHENWEEDTPFRDPNELYAFLKDHKPQEELVFSHGDFGDSNVFVRDNKISGFIDLGRSGKADKWYDIAFCVRSIQHDLGGKKEYLDLFFDLIEVQPDWDKIKYYILLDELF